MENIDAFGCAIKVKVMTSPYCMQQTKENKIKIKRTIFKYKVHYTSAKCNLTLLGA